MAIPPPLEVGAVLLGLGDSIAAGIGAPHVSEGCMALVAARLGIAHRLLAVPGETTVSMLAPGGQLGRAETLIAELAAAGERVGPVTLSIGGNDAIEAGILGDDLGLERLGAHLDRILSRLAAALASAGRHPVRTLAVQTVYALVDPAAADADQAAAGRLLPRGAPRRGVNAAIRAAAARHGVRLVDVAAAFRGRVGELTWLRSGDIHPRDAGHAVIADAYLEACGWAGGEPAAQLMA